MLHLRFCSGCERELQPPLLPVDSIDGSAVSSYNLVIKDAGGADTLKGGGGNDQIVLPDTNFVEIDGNPAVSVDVPELVNKDKDTATSTTTTS